VGNADPVQEELALAPEVLHRVGGKGLQLYGEPGARVAHRTPDAFGVVAPPRGDHGVPDVDAVVLDAGQLSLAQLEHDLLADVVDQRDAGLDQDLRAEVGVAPGDG